MALFTDRYEGFEPLSLGLHLRNRVKKAPDYYAGQLESVEQKLEELTNLVVALADALSLPAQKRVAEVLGLEYVEPPEEVPEFPLPVRTE